MIKWFYWFGAFLCITLGLLTVWLPIPTGLPLLVLGFVLLIATSRGAARWLRHRRRTHNKLNRSISWIEDRSTGRFRRILLRTRPRYFKKLMKKGEDSDL
ncbi:MULTISPECIES: hypothetical protein [Pseudovibrio]|uniref:hypothetical protein n=1 Tax=Stappiaceae TaxID=2821832 RepID=UPI002365F713|nr:MULTISPECIES: hypothetical protein [Pseudovibrio]MDD7911198.1 hypothetical protein [Pseudovibrio exalbescens]MDX5593115.1 hypothetical protein [Pseudovibrio sp. SPO723]